MASDLSSGCAEALSMFDEKEEGEISLEDVSSSEEGHINYGYGNRLPQCSNCLSTQHNSAWCTAPAKFYHSKSSSRREVDLILQDAVQGKENRHQIKESGCIGAKHTVSTLQEKNDDLVPISSDSDMEIVGLADNSKQLLIRNASKTRVKKKKKKKRNHSAGMSLDDLVSTSIDEASSECVNILKHDTTKNNPSRSHHREISPARRSSRSRVISRSPPRRHRSLIRSRSPSRRSKSPINRARSPPIKRSPRRLKSPKRAPYKSLTKPVLKKTSHFELSSHNYVDTHKLLKKVRQLDAKGTQSLEETLNKNKEHASSLKEKLTNMMKGVSDNNSDIINSCKEKSTVHTCKKDSRDVDDEEDLALLRQKALETKQKKSNKQNDQLKTEIVKKASVSMDDQDEEDLELRMIALRSAVLKKHQNRVQRGMKSGKGKKTNMIRSESPFTQSFLDSIPIPGEELLNLASPPHTPIPTNENNHAEDMELDTDVEREKEKLPYSPTDKITTNISMDTELLGIQPSDVSFISLNETNNSPNFSSMITGQDDQKPYQGKIIENHSYLPNLYYPQQQNALYVSQNSNMQYPLTNLTEISGPDFMGIHNSNANIDRYENTCSELKNNNTIDFIDTNLNQEMPYSPTDTPIYDPDLSQALPQNLGPVSTSTSSLVCLGSSHNFKQETIQEITPKIEAGNTNEADYLNEIETTCMDAIADSAATSAVEPESPSSSMITIDDLPETDADASLLTDAVKSVKNREKCPGIPSNAVEETTPEPLYMKGVPDVTKDINKIPTLINRTLVPAPILKTNKQLQQSLPARKMKKQPAPTFRSADMQPVVLDEETNAKANTSFKPMKLMPSMQKSNSVLIVPTAFHDPSHKDSTVNANINEDILSRTIEASTLVQIGAVANTEISEKASNTVNTTQRKRRSGKKGLKRKSNSSTQLHTKKPNTLCTNDDNMNTVNTNEMTEDNKENTEELGKRKNDQDISSIPTNNVDAGRKVSEEVNQQEAEIKNNPSDDVLEQGKNVEDRRQSLDEDEEALRAILLASLPKRSKTTSSTLNSTDNTTLSNISDSSNQITVNESVTKITQSTGIARNNASTTVPSSPHTSSYGSETAKNQSNPRKKINNTTVQKNVPIETNKGAGSISSVKKKLIPINKIPQKKLLKKVPIPASTRVVNNAKKYQNAMIQKKLNLQKAAIYSNQKITESKLISKMQTNENKWSASAKTSLLPETQRIVINLESDTESDSEPERQKSKTIPTSSTPLEKQSAVVNSTAEFEKNLDQFLRAVRKKQESMAAARPTSLAQPPRKDSEKQNAASLHTPLAVRHLPASQQEEYRRLKQQIIEREKLKLHRTVENNISPNNKNVEASSKIATPNSPIKEAHSKINPTVSPKSTSVNAKQLNKENFSKNFEPIKSMSISSANSQLNNNKAHVDKQGSLGVNSAKTVPRPMTNLNIRVPNENCTINAGNRMPGNALQSANTTRKVSPKAKISPGLKILSSDEVNRKFVQVQLKNGTNERVVIINNVPTVHDKTVVGRSENILGSKESVNVDACDNDMNQMIQSVEKEISMIDTRSDSHDIDSDASTIILLRANKNMDNEDTDTSGSSLRLSQIERDSPTSITMSSREDSLSLLLKSNISLGDRKSIEEDWEGIKRDVKTELNTLINLPRAELEQRLTDTEQKLVLKRYTILDELAEMSGSLRQWHMERDLQMNLVTEVRKLREQLKVAEERLQMQRNRINSIGPKVVSAHGRINVGRQECFKLARICSTLGSKIVGKEYKIPEAGAQLLNSRLKEVAIHTRQLSRKKVPSIDIPEVHESFKVDDTVSTVCTEVSNTDESLNVNDTHSQDTTILNINECVMETCEIEESLPTEASSIELNETNQQQENTVVNASTSNQENIPNETLDKEAFIDQLNSSNVPVASTSTPVSNKKLKENTELRPVPFLQERYTKKTVVPYESILTHFKTPRNTNPNGVLCPYELMGTCSDGDCQFVHQTERQAK